MTKTRDLSDFLIEGGADLPIENAHIIPGTLYPSYVASGTSNKLLDGTTNHSGAFGTAQSDGRKYYYTNIKGSKPIKDPRIGAYYGSQRYRTTSLQVLEQETAAHDKYVYSIDGREWMRFVEQGNQAAPLRVFYDAYGHTVGSTDADGHYIEITGYFNSFNLAGFSWSDQFNNGTVYLNGTSTITGLNIRGGSNSPLGSRYVDPTSLIHGNLSQSSPSLNTIKIEFNSSSSTSGIRLGSIELITQDTSSAANRSKIQIPAQNVVSFGKKFSVSATAVHYDPFTTMSYGGSGTTLSNLQSLIDTDTSLGMDAWKAGTSNYHRPWNGGRVVKWVDSTGTIKTSVNMMPPNAQNISTTASNAVSDAHVIAGTNDDRINFNTTAIDIDQSELAKTFYVREFGNGAANSAGGAGTSNTYADASMLSAADDINYVMDDGLTSISAIAVRYTNYDETLHRNATSTKFYHTFIGTGIGRHASRSSKIRDTFAQNLPYGTHTLAMEMYTDADKARWFLDGAEVIDNADSPYSSNEAVYHGIGEQLHIFQPKRPPIPEDCVVISDYMMMADFVGLGASNNDNKRSSISKGVRRLSASRDIYYNNSTWTLSAGAHNPAGFSVNAANSDYTAQNSIPFFGDKVIYMYGDPVTRFQDSACTFSSGTKGTTVDISNTNDNAIGARQFSITDGPRATTFTADSTGASNSYTTKNGLSALDLATPIHTSSHYHEFETSYLKELVGGDRNMEQTNLICSPDGKTWDEVTRDTSYIGNVVLNANSDYDSASGALHLLDEFRGAPEITNRAYWNKDWAIAYDRFICLVDGQYEVSCMGINDSGAAADASGIYINGSVQVKGHYGSGGSHTQSYCSITHNFRRGDYVQFYGMFHQNDMYSGFHITRVG